MFCLETASRLLVFWRQLIWSTISYEVPYNADSDSVWIKGLCQKAQFIARNYCKYVLYIYNKLCLSGTEWSYQL